MEDSPEKIDRRGRRASELDREFEQALNKEAERYISFKLQGYTPVEAVKQMDKEDGRERTESATKVHSQRMEKRTARFRENGVGVTEMSDAEFERWQRVRLEHIAMFPKEATAFAMTAVEKLAELRKQRLYGSYESALRTLEITLDELVRLADIEIRRMRGFEQQLARREADKSGAGEALQRDPQSEDDSSPDNAASHTERVVGDTSSIAAILGALTAFRDQEIKIAEALDRAIGKIHDATDAGDSATA